MTRFVTANGRLPIEIDLDRDPLGQGGEGRVYRVLVQGQTFAAKIFSKALAEEYWRDELLRQPIPPSQPHAWLAERRANFAERLQKLAVMLANPPEDLNLKLSGNRSFTWPTDTLHHSDGNSEEYGYLMPLVESSITLGKLAHGSSRVEGSIECDARDLLVAAHSLATAVAGLHAKGYVIGDIKDLNVLVNTKNMQVTIIDTDSFQVPAKPKNFPCRVFSQEYSPPERTELAAQRQLFDPFYDCYSLGVVLFLLLQDGIHPYFAKYCGPGQEPVTEFGELMQRGLFPYSQKFRGDYRPLERGLILWDGLPDVLQELFLKCFGEGHHKPTARPSAFDWRIALEAVLDNEKSRYLRRCTRQRAHYYRADLGAACSWCKYEGWRKSPPQDAFVPKPGPPPLPPLPPASPQPPAPPKSPVSPKPSLPPQPPVPPLPAWLPQQSRASQPLSPPLLPVQSLPPPLARPQRNLPKFLLWVFLFLSVSGGLGLLGWRWDDWIIWLVESTRNGPAMVDMIVVVSPVPQDFAVPSTPDLTSPDLLSDDMTVVDMADLDMPSSDLAPEDGSLVDLADNVPVKDSLGSSAKRLFADPPPQPDMRVPTSERSEPRDAPSPTPHPPVSDPPRQTPHPGVSDTAEQTTHPSVTRGGE